MYSSAKSLIVRWIGVAGVMLGAQLTLAAPSVDEAVAAIGRPATTAEIRAWDIDVRPDFKGLPPGSGSVEDGEGIWLEKCAVCHGDFGDSNEYFSPIALGNVTEDDIESGRVEALSDPGRPRTTLMKLATLSTLWDFINRAMPWNAPKSLTPDEVYALVAYILNLEYVVDEDFVLSDENIAEAQAMMLNRNGMTREHGMWSVDGTPDVVGSDCISNCAVDVTVTSSIPDYARNAHGNLRDQMSPYGPFRGINTAGDEDASAAAFPVNESAASPDDLLAQYGCVGCHQLDSKMVGPAFNEVMAKYAGRDDAIGYLSGKIRSGGSGVWGSMQMPPMPQVTEDDAARIAAWLATE